MNNFLVTLFTVGIIISAFPLCTFAQDSVEVVILSPIVGDSIDAVEHTRYRLFDAVKNFSSAVIMRLSGGEFKAAITVTTPSGEEITSMDMPESLIYYFAEKIEHFNELKSGTYVIGSHRPPIFIGGKKVEWQLRTPASQIRHDTRKSLQREINKDIRVSVTVLNGDQYAGSILFASDSSLMIWRSNEQYSSEKLNDLAVYINPLEIKQIVVEKADHTVSGMGTGFLVGGGIGALIGFASGDDEGGFMAFSAGTKALFLGISLGVPSAIIGGISGAVQGIDDEYRLQGDKEKYVAVLSKLKENAIFPLEPPTDLRLFQSEKRKETPSITPEQITQESIQSSEPSVTRLHISLGGGWMKSQASSDIIDAFNASGFGGTTYGGWFGPTTYPIDSGTPFSWNVALDFSITDQLQLGVERSNFAQQEIHGTYFVYEYAHGTSYSVLCGYVPVRVDPMLLSRSEFAVAAGISYNSLTVYMKSPNAFTVNRHEWGFSVRISYDYYVSEYFSLQCKAEGKFIPSVTVPAKNFSSLDLMLKQHSVNFSGLDLSLGVRCHL